MNFNLANELVTRTAGGVMSKFNLVQGFKKILMVKPQLINQDVTVIEIYSCFVFINMERRYSGFKIFVLPFNKVFWTYVDCFIFLK